MTFNTTYSHQQIVRNVFRLLDKHLSSGELLFAPVDIHLGETVIRPDVFFISENNHQCTLRADDTIQGAPDLIVEISSEKEQDTISSRLQRYESSGVREVWVMTPEKLTLELHLLVDDQFVHRGAFAHDGQFRSLVIGGKTISVKALFGEYLEQHYAFIE